MVVLRARADQKQQCRSELVVEEDSRASHRRHQVLHNWDPPIKEAAGSVALPEPSTKE